MRRRRSNCWSLASCVVSSMPCPSRRAAFPARPPGQPSVEFFPVLHLALGLVAADAVGFLHLADQLVALAVDLGDLIVGQLAPLGLDLAAELLPVAFDAIPVHALLL